MRLAYDQDNVTVPAEMIEALRQGSELYALFHSPAYKRILDWFEAKCNEKLVIMRQSRSDDDRMNNNLLLMWRDREELMREFQIFVQNSIEQQQAVAQEIQSSGLQLDDYIDFGT